MERETRIVLSQSIWTFAEGVAACAKQGMSMETARIVHEQIVRDDLDIMIPSCLPALVGELRRDYGRVAIARLQDLRRLAP